jgi:F-type H+-transporting ATPase subunit gamma
MPGNLKEVRTRIVSVKSTMQITKAMKMVSAAKLRRATERIIQIRPYSNQLNDILSNIVSNLQAGVNLSLAEEREVKKVLIVLISGEKGLCGAFNSNVVKLTRTLINEQYAELSSKGAIEIMFLGKKGLDGFKATRYQLNSNHIGILNHLEFSNVADIAQSIMDRFEAKEFDRVDVVYNMFKNAASQMPTVEQYLPVKTQVKEGKEKMADYIFEPDKEQLLMELVPKILKTQFFRFLLDSNASEHGARMTAMDKATENANELLKGLSIMYNRARQAAITTELSEIVSGAAALSSE